MGGAGVESAYCKPGGLEPAPAASRIPEIIWKVPI